jgi:hypothetical protein
VVITSTSCGYRSTSPEKNVYLGHGMPPHLSFRGAVKTATRNLPGTVASLRFQTHFPSIAAELTAAAKKVCLEAPVCLHTRGIPRRRFDGSSE